MLCIYVITNIDRLRVEMKIVFKFKI